MLKMFCGSIFLCTVQCLLLTRLKFKRGKAKQGKSKIKKQQE